jgi:hypothetical protein
MEKRLNFNEWCKMFDIIPGKMYHIGDVRAQESSKFWHQYNNAETQEEKDKILHFCKEFVVRVLPGTLTLNKEHIAYVNKEIQEDVDRSNMVLGAFINK